LNPRPKTQDLNIIPVVIIHLGNQDYFQDCVKVNSKTNKVYVIGDHTNQTISNQYPNVVHIDQNTLITQEINLFRQQFFNYSSNSVPFELICFLRIFYLKRFLEVYPFKRVFHVDSDCVVFHNVNDLFQALPENTDIAYSKMINENPYDMVGCVHNAFLTRHFCEVFVQLCFDIYVDKSKFVLIEPKIQWHLQNKKPGGICDMTLYYLMFSQNLVDVYDLNTLIEYQGETSTFDHNISISYGYAGDATYEMGKNLKNIKIMNGAAYAMDSTTRKLVRLLTIHFSGTAKRVLKSTCQLILGVI